MRCRKCGGVVNPICWRCWMQEGVIRTWTTLMVVLVCLVALSPARAADYEMCAGHGTVLPPRAWAQDLYLFTDEATARAYWAGMSPAYTLCEYEDPACPQGGVWVRGPFGCPWYDPFCNHVILNQRIVGTRYWQIQQVMWSPLLGPGPGTDFCSGQRGGLCSGWTNRCTWWCGNLIAVTPVPVLCPYGPLGGATPEPPPGRTCHLYNADGSRHLPFGACDCTDTMTGPVPDCPMTSAGGCECQSATVSCSPITYCYGAYFGPSLKPNDQQKADYNSAATWIDRALIGLGGYAARSKCGPACKAACVVAGVIGKALAEGLRIVAAVDPEDLNYTQVAVVTPQAVDPVVADCKKGSMPKDVDKAHAVCPISPAEAAAMNALHANEAMIEAVGRALATTTDRGTTAATHGNMASKQLQEEAYNNFILQLKALLQFEIAQRQSLATLFAVNDQDLAAYYGDVDTLQALQAILAGMP